MNKKTILLSFPLFSLALTSCGQVMNWKDNLDKYVVAMQYHADFNILQLTDIHWNVNTSTASSKQYLDKVIKEADAHVKEADATAKIDLIELTGDQFMLANTYHVKTFVEYMETKAVEYGFKYAIIWGNHDRHGLYSPNWLADQYRKASNCIYIEPEDNLYGRSNFVINLSTNGTDDPEHDPVVWQIANLDSGASFSESPLAIGRNYDYIRKDQTQWWIKQNERAGNAPTIAYYHIPQQDNQVAWDLIKEAGAPFKNKFFKLEGFGDSDKPEYASDFISKGKDQGTLKAAFMGHAHNVDWTVDFEGVVVGLGVKTGPELYYAHIDPNSSEKDMIDGLASVNASLPADEKIDEKFDLIGASLVTLKEEGLDKTFDLEHLYLNEREGTSDFVRWVKW